MLYIIYGNDPLACGEALDKLKASLDADGSLATNTDTFDARTSTAQEVMGACNTVPFLGDTRLVLLDGLLKAVSGVKKGRVARPKRRATVDEGDAPEAFSPWDALAAFVPDMPPSTTLVLTDEEVPTTNAMLKALGPLGKVEHCSPPDEKQLPAWVTARAKKIGLKLDSPAAKLLADLIGPDSYMLASELDKLLAFSGGQIVRDKDVRELVSRAKEHKGWALSDAVVAGQGAVAARVLSELFDDGSHPGQLLATLTTEYRKIAVAKDMLERGESGAAIGARINARGYGLDKRLEQAERLTWPAIRECYARLVQAELDLKQGLMDDRLALELAVQELAARPVATARR